MGETPSQAVAGMAEDWVPVYPGLFDYPAVLGQKPALLASQCQGCGHIFFPARQLCRHCLTPADMDRIRLASDGVIYAATVVHVNSPAGIEAPYACGYVDIPANGVRVFALFTGEHPAWFATGRRVEVVFEEVARSHEQKKIIGYKYRPLV